MKTLQVRINLGPDSAWADADAIVRKHHPRAKLGQMSRTATYPHCDSTCDEGCGHESGLRYSVKVTLP